MGPGLNAKRRNRVEFEARRRIFPLSDKTGSKAMSEAIRHYHVFETAMGFCAIAWSEAGIARFQLPVEKRRGRRTIDAPPRPRRGAGSAVRRRLRRSWRRRNDTSTARKWTSRRSGSTSPARTHSSRRFMPPCAGSAGERTTTYGALAKEVGAGRESGARCRRGDGQESGAVDHSLSPGAGRGRQDRRFLGARRLENEGPDAGAGRRSRRMPPEAAQQSFSF